MLWWEGVTAIRYYPGSELGAQYGNAEGLFCIDFAPAKPDPAAEPCPAELLLAALMAGMGEPVRACRRSDDWVLLHSEREFAVDLDHGHLSLMVRLENNGENLRVRMTGSCFWEEVINAEKR